MRTRTKHLITVLSLAGISVGVLAGGTPHSVDAPHRGAERGVARDRGSSAAPAPGPALAVAGRFAPGAQRVYHTTATYSADLAGNPGSARAFSIRIDGA